MKLYIVCHSNKHNTIHKYKIILFYWAFSTFTQVSQLVIHRFEADGFISQILFQKQNQQSLDLRKQNIPQL